VPFLLLHSSLGAQTPATPPAPATRQTPTRDPAVHATLIRFLRQSIGMDSAAVAAAFTGTPYIRVIEAEEKRDVAVFGLTTLTVSRETYDARVRDFPRWLAAPSRPRFGIFSDPPAAADVAAVVIPQRDVEDMKSCKPGDCVVKLPAVDMSRIQAETDWKAPDLGARMNAFARRRLVEYVADYRTRGDSAMALYDDRKGATVQSREAFAALLAASPYVYQHVPSLERYFATYPRERLGGAAEVIYWSEDVMPRLRPILSVTHQVVYAPPELPGATFIAAKQIYANHYFEAMVDLTYAVDRRVLDGQDGIFLMTFRRYRFDNLPSGGLLNIRGRAINALKDQLLADLKRQKATLEGAR
jgi:hypothetical protein